MVASEYLYGFGNAGIFVQYRRAKKIAAALREARAKKQEGKSGTNQKGSLIT
jgi:hypothetical protein